MPSYGATILDPEHWRSPGDDSLNQHHGASPAPPPFSPLRPDNPRCCDCSRRSTCSLTRPRDRSPACACKLAHRPCTSCACSLHCRNKRPTLPTPLPPQLHIAYGSAAPTVYSVSTAPVSSHLQVDTTPSGLSMTSPSTHHSAASATDGNVNTARHLLASNQAPVPPLRDLQEPPTWATRPPHSHATRPSLSITPLPPSPPSPSQSPPTATAFPTEFPPPLVPTTFPTAILPPDPPTTDPPPLNSIIHTTPLPRSTRPPLLNFPPTPIPKKNHHPSPLCLR